MPLCRRYSSLSFLRFSHSPLRGGCNCFSDYDILICSIFYRNSFSDSPLPKINKFSILKNVILLTKKSLTYSLTGTRHSPDGRFAQRGSSLPEFPKLPSLSQTWGVADMLIKYLRSCMAFRQLWRFRLLWSSHHCFLQCSLQN